LAGKKPQTLCAWCFQVEQGDIVIKNFNAPHPGGNFLSWYFLAALGLRRFKHYIADGSVAAHQHLAARFLFLAYEVIVVTNLTDCARHDSRQTFTAISIAATISECKA
jgi:hypothetical protein